MLQLKLSYGTEKISCLMSRHYVRANKRVYNVVIILLAVMTILSVMACLAEFKITILLQTAAAVAGIIVVNTYCLLYTSPSPRDRG